MLIMIVSKKQRTRGGKVGVLSSYSTPVAFCNYYSLAGELPLSIGGGIGQSRLCMLFLRKAHIGEIQASIWPDDMRETCRVNNIILV